MKNFKKILAVVATLATFSGFSQTEIPNGEHADSEKLIADKLSKVQLIFDQDSLNGFNEDAAWQQASMGGAPKWEQTIFVSGLKRNYINAKYGLSGNYANKPIIPGAQAPCTNVDFETGTAAGWTLTEGLNSNSTTQGGCCPSATTRFSVVTFGTDPAVPALQMVPPGAGNYTLKIGDGATIGGYAVKARQTFSVSASNSVFIYRFAVVLEDGSHSCSDQPYFNISFVDGANNPIPCGDYNIVQTGGGCTAGADPSFVTSGIYAYKNWTTRSFDLTNYIGQNVTVEFIASDCVQTGHAGWAYVDCSCQPMTLKLNGFDIPVGQTNTNFCAIGSNTLCAPPGFISYTWNGPGVTGQTTQCVNTSSAGTYSVTLGMAGASCSSPVLYSTFNLVPKPIANFSFTTTPCQNTFTVPFANTSSQNGGPAITNTVWDFDNNGTSDDLTPNPSYTFPASGTYTVELKVSNGGCVDSISKVLTVTPKPTANFNVSNACLNSATNFTSTSTPTVGIASYVWNFGDNTTGSGPNPNHTYTSPGTYTVKLVVTNTDLCKDSISKVVTISPNPVISFTSSPVCLNSVTNFTNSSTVSSGSISNWAWDFNNDGVVDNTTQNPTNTYTAPGTYTVELKATTNNGCRDSSTINVTVNAQPTASFTPANACVNFNIGLTNNSSVTAPASLVSYAWSFGAGANPASSSNQNPPSLIYNTPGIKTITLTVGASSTCSATTTQTVEVYAQPVANFSTTSVCQSTATVFTDLSTPTGSVTGWAWDFQNDGTIDNTTNAPTFTYPSSGTFTASLIATSSQGCKDTVKVTVDVWGHSIPDFATTPVCFGVATSFTNNTNTTTNLNVGGTPTYDWAFGDAGTALNTPNPTHTYTGSASGATFNATLTATTTHGCVDNAVKTVTINALPTASFTPSNACVNFNVGLVNNSTVPAPATLNTFTWSFGAGANPSASNVQSPASLIYNTPGIKTITLSLTSNQSCTATTTQTVEVYAQPVANFSTTSVCQSTATVFTDLSTPTGSITGWAWDFQDDGSIDNTTNAPTFTYPSSGTFTASLVVTSSQGCKDTVKVTVDVWGHSIPNFAVSTECFGVATSFTNNTNTTTNANVGGTPTYNWAFGDGGTALSTPNPTHTYTGSATGATFNATLTSITTHGCMDSIVKQVKINALPTATFAPVNACMNNNVVLNNTSSIPSPDAVSSYTWSFGAAATPTASNAQNPNVTYSVSGVQVITLTITANTSCTATTTQTVDIYPQPVANFSTTSVCQSTATAFIDLSTTGVGTITGWQWDYQNDAAIDNTTNAPTFTYPASGTYTAVLIATSSNGCKDTVRLPVDVWGHAIPDFTPDKVCFGTATTFSNLTNTTINANVGGTPSYAWNFADNGTSVAVSPVHTYTMGGNVNATHNVLLVVTSTHNCIDSIRKPVSVYAIPTASFTSDSVCLGSASHMIDASNGNGNVVNTFEWDFENNGNVDIFGVANPNYVFPNYGNNAVSYTVSTSPVVGLVCKNATNTITVWVNPNPNPDFTFANKCINAQPNTFDANTSTIPIGTNTNYAWAYGDGLTGTGITTTHNYATPSVFNVTLTVTSNKGCQKAVVKQTEVFAKPFMAITNSPACNGKVMTFTATTQPNSGNVTAWFWDFNGTVGTIESTGQTTGYTFPAAGNQTVTLVSETDKGCRDTISKALYVDYVPVPQFSVNKPAGCPEHCVTFSDLTPAIPGPAQNVTWIWSFGDGSSVVANSSANQSHCYTNNTSDQLKTFDIKLVVVTDKGCTDSLEKSAFITVYPVPVAAYDASPNPGNVTTPLVYFDNNSQDYTKWWWNFGDSPVRDSVNRDPSHFYSDVTAQTYATYLIVANQYGCRDTAYLKVEIGPEFTFYIPNAFSPNNNDNVNDYFTGKGIGIETYEMWIFDRWGEMIYYTDDIAKGWDGKRQGKSQECKQDVYVWKVKLKDVLGKKHEYIGHVTLLR